MAKKLFHLIITVSDAREFGDTCKNATKHVIIDYDVKEIHQKLSMNGLN